jgi:hypothetical protein
MRRPDPDGSEERGGGSAGLENRLWGFQFSKAVSWSFINQS